MSDNSDNDFSWLDEDNDSDSGLPEDDGPEFDWSDEDDNQPLADLASLRKSRAEQDQPSPEDEGDFMDDMPDWMRDIGESEAHENETSQVQYTGPVPAWMREELMGQNADESDDASVDSSPADLDEEGDFDDEAPDWLRAESPLAEETESIGDDEADLPEWLDVGEELPEDTEDLSEWMADSDAVPEQDEDVPEWMAAAEEESAFDQDELPEWMADTGSTPADDEAPEWITSASESTSAQDFVDKDGDGVPDWMQEAGVESAFDAEPADDDEAVPDWMQPEETTGFDEEDTALPSWMAEAEPPPAPESHEIEWLEDSPAFDQLEDTGSLIDDEAVPDWMATNEPPEPEPEASDLPPWMDEMADEDLMETSVAATDATDEDDLDEVPDWLSEGAPPAPVAEETPSLDEMFSSVSFDDADDEDFDLLNDIGTESEELVAMLGEEDDDDFDLLGALTGDVAADGEEIPEDDLLAAMLEAEQGTATENEMDAYVPSPDAEALAPDDDLSALFGDDEDVFAPVDDSTFDDEFEALEEPESIDGLGALFEDSAEAMDDLESDEDLAALFEDDEQEEFVEAYQTPPTAESIEEAFEQFETEISDEELDALLAEAGDAESLEAEEEAYSLFDEGEEPEVDRFFTDYDDHDDQYEDWFAGEPTQEEEPAAAVPEADMDWLDEIGGEALPFEDEEAIDAAVVGAEPDISQLTPADEDLLAEITSAVDSGQYKLDNLLDSLNRDESLELPRTGELPTLDLLESGFEFERAFDPEELAALTEERESGIPVELSPDAPDWLREMTEEAAGAQSAAAIVRRRKERPLEDLPEDLQFLHDRALELPASPGGSVAGTPLERVLGNVKNTLNVAALGVGTAGTLTGGVMLTDDQRARAQVLQQIAGSSLEGEPVSVARRRRLGLGGIGQATVGVLLLLLMVVPFVRETITVGKLPLAAFAEDTRQFAFVERVQGLFPGQHVLVAVEYGPIGAAELDEATQTLLLQIMRRGAVPVLIGGNPVGLLHASNILANISDANGGALLANRDYVVGQYIVGESVGLRSFNENIERLTATDINGDETNLSIESLNDFNLIVIVTESADRVRQWAEQVTPTADTPMLAITNQAAAPLSIPYLQRNPDALVGMLVGYGDAYTYREMVSALGAGAIQLVVPTPTQTNTPRPTFTPTEVPAVVATDVLTETPTTEATESPQPSATEAPQQTTVPEVAATNTPQPTATDQPTATPTVTPTRVIPSEAVAIAVVDADTPVNVRSGPSTQNSPVAVLQPGAEALVIGQNADASWYNILLDNAIEGWIAASVVRIEEIPSGSDGTSSDLIEVGVVIAGDIVNVRSGPGTGFAPVGSASPGDVLPIIGRNEDESWYNVRLEDGTEGWIAAFLLRIELVTPDEETRAIFGKQTVQVSKSDVLRRVPQNGQVQDEPTPTASEVEVTEEAFSEAEATAENVPELTVLPDGTVAIVEPTADTDAYRDERWYSTTIGLVAVMIIIVVGNVWSIIRALLRRRGN